MRAAYVCADPGVPIWGRKGCSVHVQEMVRALGRAGVTVDVVAARTGGPPPSDLGHVAVHAPDGLADAARDRNADRVNGAVAAALARLGRLDCVYERHALWSSAGVAFAARAGLPGLLEVNAPLIDEHLAHRDPIDVTLARRVAAEAFSAASAIVTVSDAVAGYVERCLPAAVARTHVVPNGVDVRRFTPHVPPSRPAPPGVFTVGFSGSMKRWHDLPVLAEAFARLHRAAPRTRLLLVGDGPEADPARRRLASLGVAGAATWTGAIDPGDVPALLTSMDVVVAPAPDAADFYFSPLKVFEYMAAGRAIIATRVGQLAEVIRHEVTGLLCPPRDAIAMASALDRLRRDPLVRARLGTAARRRAVARHSWDDVAARILTLAAGRPTA